MGSDVAARVFFATLKRVVDATTLDMECQLKPSRACTQRMRLIGVRAPSPGTEEGRAAHAWVVAWIRQHAPVQPPVLTIASPKPAQRGRRRRYPAHIHAPDGACLNRDLIAAGHGRATTSGLA